MGDSTNTKEMGSLIAQFEESTGMNIKDGLLSVFDTWRKGYTAGQVDGLSRASEIYKEVRDEGNKD